MFAIEGLKIDKVDFEGVCHSRHSCIMIIEVAIWSMQLF